jgi:hypothetical protein
MLPGHEVLAQSRSSVRKGGEGSQDRFVTAFMENEISGTCVGEAFKFFLDRANDLILKIKTQ